MMGLAGMILTVLGLLWLMSLLNFLQSNIKDNSDNIIFTFNSFPSEKDYYYNGKSYDDDQMLDLNRVSESTTVAKQLLF